MMLYRVGPDSITIMPAGVVSLAGKKATSLATIQIDEPDFCVEFNVLLRGNDLEDKRQNLCTIRYQSTKLPIMSEGATKPNFSVGYTIATCHLTLKESLAHLKTVNPNNCDSTQQA